MLEPPPQPSHESEEQARAATDRRAAALAAEVEERLAGGEVEIPVLPAVASRVVSLTAGSPDADAAALAALVQRDQTLAGNVLKAANSVAYGGRVTIVSLQQAVARMGMRLVGDIALAVSLRAGVFSLAGYETELRGMWRHSLATGAFAKEIARLQRRNVETAFMCGLLHGVGRPMVLKVLSELTEGNGRLQAGLALAVVERCQVSAGLLLAGRWELPPAVCAAIAEQEEGTPVTTHAADVNTTRLAMSLGRWLVSEAGAQQDTALEAVRALPAAAELNLYPDDMGQLLGKSGDVLGTVEALAL